MSHHQLGLLSALMCALCFSLVAQSPCGPNHCITMDGVDDYIIIPHNPALNFDATDPFTVEAWIRTSVLPPSGPPWPNANPLPSIIEKWNSTCGAPYPYALRLNVSGQITGSAFSATGCSGADSVVWGNPAQVSDNQWHHVAYCRDNAGTCSLWIDGVLIDTDTNVPNGPTTNNFPLYIGRRAPGGSYVNHWTGEMDEIRISSTARYSSTFRPATWHESDASTVMLLHLDEGMGQFAFDSSGLGNHGQFGSTGFAGPDDPAWFGGLPSSFSETMHTQVNGGPSSAVAKTFAGGDVVSVGVDVSCSPGLMGLPITILANLGVEAAMVAQSPPPSVSPVVPGLITLHAYSIPVGNAAILGDGMNLAAAGLGTDFGLGPYFGGQAPFTLQMPVGVFPSGFQIRLQAVYPIVEAQATAIGATNAALLTAQ